MNDMPPGLSGRSPGECWPLPPHMLGVARDASRDALLLERCFDGAGARWSDALVARTRRHIGGCATAVEMSLRVELERLVPGSARLAEALPDALGWTALQRRPALLGGDLIRHFRDRAGISLMLRDDQQGRVADSGPAAETLFPPAAAETLSMLMLAQAGWDDSSPDPVPMRADLSAEAMEQLVWTLMALIADALGRTGLMPVPDMLALTDRTGRAVLSRHDEQTGPFALAALLAHQIREQAWDDETLLWLARNRQMLALIAVIADRTGIEAATLVSAFVEGPEPLLFNLCRTADFPREVAVRLVLGRQCLSRGVEDSVLVHYADAYEQMPRADAAQAVAPLRMTGRFRDRLSVLRDRIVADEC